MAAILAAAAALRDLRAPAGSPVEKHGQLTVMRGELSDQENGPVTLRGISLATSDLGGEFWSAKVVQSLAADWHVSLIRAPIGVEAEDSYMADPAAELARLDVVIRAAVEAGIYVLIDWHANRKHVALARNFFAEVAGTYGALPNVLFEIWHEPEEADAGTWSRVIKPYHEQVLPVIREVTPNLVILGTGDYCEGVDEASTDPVLGSNLAYSLHFYAATPGHKEPLRKKVETALSQGLCVFATEWGTCECTGDGFVDLSSSRTWMEYLEDSCVSHVNWGLYDKTESACALVPGASTEGGWTEEQLTESGRFVREMLRGGGRLELARRAKEAKLQAGRGARRGGLVASLCRCLRRSRGAEAAPPPAAAGQNAVPPAGRVSAPEVVISVWV